MLTRNSSGYLYETGAGERQTARRTSRSARSAGEVAGLQQSRQHLPPVSAAAEFAFLSSGRGSSPHRPRPRRGRSASCRLCDGRRWSCSCGRRRGHRPLELRYGPGTRVRTGAGSESAGTPSRAMPGPRPVPARVSSDSQKLKPPAGARSGCGAERRSQQPVMVAKARAAVTAPELRKIMARANTATEEWRSRCRSVEGFQRGGERLHSPAVNRRRPSA